MTIKELATLIGAKLLTNGNDNAEVTSGLTCDLLSYVMAKGIEGCAWVTVQTHMNVIAVAALHDMACVILPQDADMDASVLAKAEEEGISVLSTPMGAYEICGKMFTANIPASAE